MLFGSNDFPGCDYVAISGRFSWLLSWDHVSPHLEGERKQVLGFPFA
jgi:hypothetical protein